MANDKQSSNELGPIVTVGVLGMALIALIKLIIAVVFMAIFTIGIALSLAYKEKILRKSSIWQAILRKFFPLSTSNTQRA